ncbi:TIGR00296 family protein [archaeon]|nr:MAG: TIGR00296 family protein [archaeon]
MLSIEEGTTLVRIARRSIEAHLRNEVYTPESYPDSFKERSGIFVTLSTYPDHCLRGCIGFPEPSHRLIDAATEAAIIAATRDPRFASVSIDEMDSITVEVTVLTPPVLVERRGRDYLDEFEVGTHGLIVEKGFYKGLLLPQVPVEWGWDKEEFISQTCVKAGLQPDAWLTGDIDLYTFKGEVFAEKEPRGTVVFKEK